MSMRFQCLSLFWHFLDIVWIYVFTIVYLMGWCNGTASRQRCNDYVKGLYCVTDSDHYSVLHCVVTCATKHGNLRDSFCLVVRAENLCTLSTLHMEAKSSDGRWTWCHWCLPPLLHWFLSLARCGSSTRWMSTWSCRPRYAEKWICPLPNRHHFRNLISVAAALPRKTTVFQCDVVTDDFSG